MEDILLSEMSDRERHILYDITYVESKNYSKLLTKLYNKKEANSQIQNELVVTGGERGERQHRGERLGGTNYWV